MQRRKRLARGEARRWVRSVVAGVAILWFLMLMVPSALAHVAGVLQLHIAELRLTPETTGSTTIDAYVVDTDSGRAAPGFGLTATAVDSNGRSGGKTELADQGNGHYRNSFELPPGKWTVKVDAGPGLSGASAVPTSKSATVEVTSATAVPGPSGSPAGAPARGRYRVMVQIMSPEEALAAQPSSLYVPVKVSVSDAASGEPVGPEQDVAVTPKNAQGEVAEGFPLAYPWKDNTGSPGVYKGWVILPHGGQWTLVASVNDKTTKVSLGVGTVDTTVEGPALESYTKLGLNPKQLTANQRTIKKVGSIVFLWSHTMFALTWGVLIGLLALLAVPKGRRLLSLRTSNFLDSHMTGLVRGAMWATALVIGTGTVNLLQETVYKVPVSPSQAQKVFELPYAKPYFLALGTKLTAYLLMVLASVPLVLAARRRAELLDELQFEIEGTRRPGWSPSMTRSEGGIPAPSTAAEGRSAATQLLEKEERPAMTRSGHMNQGKVPLGLRLALGVLCGGGLVLSIALTTLKFIHVVAEGLRS